MEAKRRVPTLTEMGVNHSGSEFNQDVIRGVRLEQLAEELGERRVGQNQPEEIPSEKEEPLIGGSRFK